MGAGRGAGGRRRRLGALALAALAAASLAGTARAQPSPSDFRGPLRQPWRGDLDRMIAETGVLRLLVPFNQTHYFLDQGRPRGLSYETGERFERFVRKRRELRPGRFDVVYVPVARDRLIPDLVAGRGDVAAANLSITPARRAEVDFSAPFVSGVRELVVTSSEAPPVERLADLAGRPVWVRASSSHAESLAALNARFRRQGLPPAELRPVDEHLEAEDILEMVSHGLVPTTVADSHLLDLWSGILDGLRVSGVALREDVEIAWAFREGSPELAAALNVFVAKHREGTLVGNVLLKRYLENNRWVRNPGDRAERDRFEAMIELFERYGDRYGFDALLLAAQGYQESRLDQSKRSPAGAIGVMQLLPSTAASDEVGIPDIERLESNIHAGAKYMRVLQDRYFADPELDELQRYLFALAAYNAGPSRIRRLRQDAAARGLDPNRWFENVEVVVANEVGSEPVRYVRNVFKYYTAYQWIEEQRRAREAARQNATGG